MFKTLTQRIEELQQKAGEAGDLHMVAICSIALDGDVSQPTLDNMEAKDRAELRDVFGGDGGEYDQAAALNYLREHLGFNERLHTDPACQCVHCVSPNADDVRVLRPGN